MLAEEIEVGMKLRVHLPVQEPSWIQGIWGFTVYYHYRDATVVVTHLPSTGVIRGPGNLADDQWDPVTKLMHFVGVKKPAWGMGTLLPIEWLEPERVDMSKDDNESVEEGRCDFCGETGSCVVSEQVRDSGVRICAVCASWAYSLLNQ